MVAKLVIFGWLYILGVCVCWLYWQHEADGASFILVVVLCFQYRYDPEINLDLDVNEVSVGEFVFQLQCYWHT